jgi:hypothetical protein
MLNVSLSGRRGYSVNLSLIPKMEKAGRVGNPLTTHLTPIQGHG